MASLQNLRIHKKIRPALEFDRPTMKNMRPISQNLDENLLCLWFKQKFQTRGSHEHKLWLLRAPKLEMGKGLWNFCKKDDTLLKKKDLCFTNAIHPYFSLLLLFWLSVSWENFFSLSNDCTRIFCLKTKSTWLTILG